MITPMAISILIGLIIIVVMCTTFAWVNKNHPSERWYKCWIAFCTILTILAIYINGFLIG